MPPNIEYNGVNIHDLARANIPSYKNIINGFQEGKNLKDRRHRQIYEEDASVSEEAIQIYEEDASVSEEAIQIYEEDASVSEEAISGQSDVTVPEFFMACKQGNVDEVSKLYHHLSPIILRIYDILKRTPLHYVALGKGSIDIAKFLIHSGANLHEKALFGDTVFHIACYHGQLELVKFLYETDDSVAKELKENQDGPLHLVADGTGSVDVANYLINKCDVHAKNSDGETVFHIACCKGHLELVKFLYDKDRSLIKTKNTDGETVFHIACCKGHLELVKFLYDKDKSLIKTINNDGYTSLHQTAIGTGSMGVTKFLITEGADINTKDNNGSTAFHLACSQGHLELVKFLYQEDPSLVHEINKDNLTALHYAAVGGSVDVADFLITKRIDIHKKEVLGNTVFHVACYTGYLELVKCLHKKYPLFINALDNENGTPLHSVAEGSGSIAVTKFLINQGADTYVKDSMGSTVFLLACFHGHLELVEFLNENFSEKHALNKRDQTPLHYVAMGNGSVDVASYLLEKGANLHATDYIGNTIFHAACHKGHLNLVKFLNEKDKHDESLIDKHDKSLIDKHDKSLISTTNKFHHPPLHIVAMGTGSVELASYLLKNKVDIYAKCDTGNTVLHFACYKGHSKLVKFLYDNAPRIIHVLNENKQTPLHYTAKGTGSVDVADFLIEKGVHVDAQDIEGSNVFHLACHNGQLELVEFLYNKDPMLIKTQNKNGETCLDYVAGRTNSKDVTNFLIHKVTELFSPTESGKETCLIHYAAETGHVKIIKVLIHLGCALDAQDHQGQTALHITCRNGFLDATKLLVSKGANLVLQDKEGKAALIYAIENNRPETVSFILGQNIDLVTDKQGKTPLQYAMKTGNNNLIELLAQYKMELSKEDVYIKQMELAIAADCSCLGEFTTHAMLQDYFTQYHTTREKSPISRIAVQALRLLCKKLQEKIPEKLLVKVWPAYEDSKRGPVSLISYVTDIPDKKIKSLFGLKVIYRLYNFVNEEESVVIHSDLEKNNPILGEDLKKIVGIIDENAKELRAKHSNLTMISCSPVKSSNKGTSLMPKNCIVLYCRYKGKIPFGEMEFPPQIGGFSTDIREGFVSFNSGVSGQQTTLPANDRHDVLKMGCSISCQGSDSSGTLGGFIDWEHKVHFITCAHVLISSKDCVTEDGIIDINDADNNIKVCQPGDGDEGSGRYSAQQRLCGKVVKACFNLPEREVSVDVALVEIDHIRAPAISSFVGIQKKYLKECGFDQVPEMSQMKVINYPLGKEDLDRRIFKVGARTGITRGVLQLDGKQAWDSPGEAVEFSGQNNVVHIKKQITVLGVAGSFFMGGDSGALVFMHKNNINYCLGLAIASDSAGKCLVTPIKEVLDTLNLREDNLLGYVP